MGAARWCCTVAFRSLEPENSPGKQTRTQERPPLHTAICACLDARNLQTEPTTLAFTVSPMPEKSAFSTSKKTVSSATAAQHPSNVTTTAVVGFCMSYGKMRKKQEEPLLRVYRAILSCCLAAAFTTAAASSDPCTFRIATSRPISSPSGDLGFDCFALNTQQNVFQGAKTLFH